MAVSALQAHEQLAGQTGTCTAASAACREIAGSVVRACSAQGGVFTVCSRVDKDASSCQGHTLVTMPLNQIRPDQRRIPRHIPLPSTFGSSGIPAWGAQHNLHRAHVASVCNACTFYHVRRQTCTGSSSSLPSSFTSAGTMLPMAKRMTSPGTSSEASITCSNPLAIKWRGTADPASVQVKGMHPSNTATAATETLPSLQDHCVTT